MENLVSEQKDYLKKIPDGKLDVKIIAFDLDDTLLDNQCTVSDETVKSIRKCAERGIYIVLCSGRTERGILPHVKRLDIAGTETGRFIIAINGASVFDLHKRLPLRTLGLDGKTLQEVHHLASEYGFGCHVADEDTIVADRDTVWTRKDSLLCNLNFRVEEDFDSYITKGYPKMIIPGPVEQVNKVLPELREKLKGKADVFTSKPFFIEVMPSGVGKGQSLLWLSNQLNIPRYKTMAFGDSFNDESMLRAVEYSVAMCNGQDQIKELCRFVTRKTNNEDGIADFLNSWVL